MVLIIHIVILFTTRTRTCANLMSFHGRDTTRDDHDDVIKWKHFPRNWPLVQGIHRSPVNSPHKGQWRGALINLFDLRLNERLNKQWWGCWFDTPSCPFWRHCNEIFTHKADNRGPVTNVDELWWGHCNYIHSFIWNVITHPCLVSTAVGVRHG